MRYDFAAEIRMGIYGNEKISDNAKGLRYDCLCNYKFFRFPTWMQY